MTNIFDVISGGIPGGAVLLIAALVFSNLTLIFLKKSGLFGDKSIVKKTIMINVAVVTFYILLWVYKRPVPLPERIIVLPTLTDSVFNSDAKSFLLADIFKKNSYVLSGNYLVHHWDWMYETLPDEKKNIYKEWYILAGKLNPYLLIESEFKSGNTIHIAAKYGKQGSDDANIEMQISREDIATGIEALLEKLDIGLRWKRTLLIPEEKSLNADIKIAHKQMDIVLQELEGDSSISARIACGKAYVFKGFKFVYNKQKMKFVKIVNPDFESAKAILYPILKKKMDSPEISYLLGRMAIREQDFESGEIFLKRTFGEEYWNPRIFYYLSFLLSSRLEELGFNRRTVLENAVQLDPGFLKAVLDLANDYWLKGTGSAEGFGSQYALHTLSEYLKLDPDNEEALNLMATIYIKTEKLDKAEEIYSKLAVTFPKESNYIYDLGIVAYMHKEYPKALEFFKSAIAMDKNLDAYLYAGITLEMMGNKEEALKYYQDRVRFKTVDDDEYAREAMKAIRKILEESGSQPKDSLN